MSMVSGGSVLGALYAYRDHESFEMFDREVVSLLRSGLQWRIVRAAILTAELPKILGTFAVNGLLSLTSVAAHGIVGFTGKLWGWSPRHAHEWLRAAEERIPIWGSFTTAFEKLLDRQFFRGVRLRDVKIRNLEIVFNTCDLRTGTAFRFGSEKGGGWRYGEIEDGNTLPVSKAVAASSAFPALLPPLRESFRFKRGGVSEERTVVLTDGGVYDNLGVAVLEPGRSTEFTVNNYSATHIICLNAGAGQFPIGGTTFWLGSRLKKSFDAVYRKAQDAAYQRLHAHVASGALKGFALVYLGQNDQALPVLPPDLVRREAVRDYPTDYAAMSDGDIELITRRGERLTRLLVSHYLSGLQR
jgi:NTE family protein